MQKKNNNFFLQKFFAFLNVYEPQTQLIKINISLDSTIPYKWLLENQKTGGFRELFLPENDFQTSSTVDFPKNIQFLEVWKATNLVPAHLFAIKEEIEKEALEPFKHVITISPNRGHIFKNKLGNTWGAIMKKSTDSELRIYMFSK